ncbi:MAG: CDP-glucose 4,6-dehydratase [Pseudomonadota bacterium]
MAGMGPGASAFLGRNVLITGHTGFKGSWLTLWLAAAGARVSGLALDPPTNPALFDLAGVARVLAADLRVDIRDGAATRKAIADVAPDVVFHLAAQPLVRASYDDPLDTYATNVMGTAHVIDGAARSGTKAFVCVTTDKVYHNREWVHPYREADRLGGHDPYSASKAGAELVATSLVNAMPVYAPDAAMTLATARAGNVIGGGDFAADRLVPDCINAFCANMPVRLRNPTAVRPWQHVLDPLSGYLTLAAWMLAGGPTAHAFNFGPDAGNDAAVGDVAQRTAAAWGEGACVIEEPGLAAAQGAPKPAPKEAGTLRLDSTKARLDLGWQPVWDLETSIARTVDWYGAWHEGGDLRALTQAQIEEFRAASNDG